MKPWHWQIRFRLVYRKIVQRKKIFCLFSKLELENNSGSKKPQFLVVSIYRQKGTVVL